MRALALTADSTAGRVLIALRAGAMSSGQLHERFLSPGNALADLSRNKLIGVQDGIYRITAAGLAACPNRRDIRVAEKSPKSRPHGWSSTRKGKKHEQSTTI